MKLYRRPGVFLLALVATATFGLAACGGDDDDNAQGDTATEETEGDSSQRVSATASDINPHPRDDIMDGGTLKLAISEFPPQFNRGHLDGSLADTSAVVGPTTGGPFDFDATGTPVINEDYVKSAELVETSPKQVVVYKLNPDTKWYDTDQPITAEDYIAEWKASNGSRPEYQVSSTQGYDKIESVEQGADQFEVVVTFGEPYTDWQALFGGLLPARINNDPALFNESLREVPPPSAGPFKLGNIDKTAQTITLVRNEKWWGRTPKLERIIYRVIASDAHIDALANKEIDIIDIGPDVAKYDRARKISGIDIRKAGGPNFRHITLNGRGEILKDVRVRQAFAMSVNREALAKVILEPLGVEVVTLDNHIFMTNQRGYQDNAGELGRYDPDAAGKLLDEAGWTRDGNGIREKDGKPLRIRMVIPSQVAVSQQESTLLRSMMTAVGIDLFVDTVPTGDFFEKHIKPGDFDITVFSWIGTPFPISSTRSIYKSVPEGAVVEQNYGRIGSEEIDSLFEKATAEFDREMQIQLANQIDTLIWKNVHSLTTYQRPEIVAVRADLANTGASGFASEYIEDVGFLKADKQ